LPFCHIALQAKKPRLSQYPRQIDTLGDHIRKGRFELGLFQRDMAEKIGVSEATIYNWEGNRRARPGV